MTEIPRLVYPLPLMPVYFPQLFDQLRTTSPEVLKKLVPVQGDIMLPGLGISPDDATTLASNVSVVFHAAATVKFDEALKLSLQMNVLGTKRLIELCHKMTKLVVSFNGGEEGRNSLCTLGEGGDKG